MEFTFTANLWEYQGKGAWHFITVDSQYADVIKEATASFPKKGFGSVKVAVTIGSNSWQTSIFPDSSNGTYLLPLKKSVRTAEKIEDGDKVNLTIKILDV